MFVCMCERVYLCAYVGGERGSGQEGGLFSGLEDGRSILKECSPSVGKTLVCLSASQLGLK